MSVDAPLNRSFRRLKARLWERRGRVPHAYGYNAAKWFAIERGARVRDTRYGWHDAGLDERVVEYAWMFERVGALDRAPSRVLDAGSVLNHGRLLRWWDDARYPPISIVTLAYEGRAAVSNAVRYEFADLRQLPYRDEWFSIVVSLSTLEHVGLDNTGYGGAAERSADPNTEVRRSVAELRRVTVAGGTLLLSVPFGARGDRGWLRVFDEPDLDQLLSAPGWSDSRALVFRSTKEGWRQCSPSEARDSGYNEPPGTGSRTAPPWVAAAEAVALVEMKRR